MTISTTTNRDAFTGDGSQTSYPLSFPVVSSTHIDVNIDDANVAASGNYAVTISGTSATVVFTTAPASAAKIVIRRIVPQTQTVDYVPYDTFPAETHEAALDKLTQVDQQLQEDINRSMQLPSSATSATDSATSATASAASATSAATSYDDFNDRFLGAKASDPTLDNDGDALIDGAMFFDTTLNITKVYDLGTTAWLRTTPTTSDQTKINTVSGISAAVSNVSSISSAVSGVNAISADVSGANAISADISGVNASGGDVTTTAANSANITTTAGSIANVNLTAGSIANVNTVAGSIADVNRYAAEYTIASTAPSSPTQGDLWYDSSTTILKYYTGSAWTGITPGITTETDPNAAALALALG